MGTVYQSITTTLVYAEPKDLNYEEPCPSYPMMPISRSRRSFA